MNQYFDNHINPFNCSNFLLLPSGALWENVEALKTIGRAPSLEEKLVEPKRLEAGVFIAMVRNAKTLVAS